MPHQADQVVTILSGAMSPEAFLQDQRGRIADLLVQLLVDPSRPLLHDPQRFDHLWADPGGGRGPKGGGPDRGDHWRRTTAAGDATSRRPLRCTWRPAAARARRATDRPFTAVCYNTFFIKTKGFYTIPELAATNRNVRP